MGRESRQARRARERREQQRGRKQSSSGFDSNKWSIIAGAVLVLAVLGVVGGMVFAKGTGQSAAAIATGTAQAQMTPVPGIAVGPVQCSGNEMVSQGFYHVHSHLSIYHNGQPVEVPSQIGFDYINHECLYWMHTHQPSYGIIHIESPYKIVPTIGNFFKIWGVPLTANRVWKFTGPVHVFVNGKPYSGNPANIRLALHTDVSIQVGGPSKAPPPFNFAKYQV